MGARDPDRLDGTLPVSARHVAVIGAGISGLVTVKALREEGLRVSCFERSAQVGGLWRYDESLPNGGGPAYRALVTNTSRHKTAFSDHRWPSEDGDFPSRARVLAYVDSYADRFALREHIRSETEVTRVARGPHGWKVTSRGADSREDEPFDAVVVCSGIYDDPVIPAFENAGGFTGRIEHVMSYTGPDAYAGSRVIVIGAGSSAADIAVDLCRTARVTVAMARPARFIPKCIGGRPYDHRLTRLARLVPERIRLRLFARMLSDEYARLGLPRDTARWPLPVPPLDLGAVRSTPTSELVPGIAAGRIAYRPGIVRLEGQTAVFADGRHEDVDVVLCATGYRMRFPYLAQDLAPVHDLDEIDLYRHVFHPEAEGLAFVGMCRVAGPVPPVVEMQARWIARVFAGGAALPSPAGMRSAIVARRATHVAAGTEYMRVQYLEYLEELGALIGERQRWWRSPLAYWVGAPTAAQFRSPR